MSFDPWTASEEEALSATPGALKTSDALLEEFRGTALHKWWRAKQLKSLQASAGSGGLCGADVLWAIGVCADSQLLIPTWLAREFSRRLEAVTTASVSSYDDPEAFGAPFPPGIKLSVARLRSRQRVAVYQLARDYASAFSGEASLPRLWALFSKGSQLSEAEISRLGMDFIERIRAVGCGRSKAYELWSEALEQFGQPREVSVVVRSIDLRLVKG